MAFAWSGGKQTITQHINGAEWSKGIKRPPIYPPSSGNFRAYIYVWLNGAWSTGSECQVKPHNHAAQKSNNNIKFFFANDV